MFKAPTEEMETTLTAVASESRAWTLYHSHCSLENSVTLGACVECQFPPRKLEPLSLSPFRCDEFARTTDSCAPTATVPHPCADHKSLVVPEVNLSHDSLQWATTP